MLFQNGELGFDRL